MSGPIEKLEIADEHIPDWMQTLREGGFTDDEIDSMLSRLNKTYATQKNREYVNKELNKMDVEIQKRRGEPLTEEEKEGLRAGIESRFKSI